MVESLKAGTVYKFAVNGDLYSVFVALENLASVSIKE